VAEAGWDFSLPGSGFFGAAAFKNFRAIAMYRDYR
jgi:hypothetical protein